MDILLKIGAVLLLIAGFVYPLIAIYGLVSLLNRPHEGLPSSLGILVRLFLIATVPLVGILGGFAGLLPAVWESDVLRIVIVAAGVGALAGFLVLQIVVGRERKRASPADVDPHHL